MRLNARLPNFKAATTQGPIEFYQWQGTSWVVLFSHPADFTPVCTTELGRLAVHAAHFERRDVKLLALSADRLDEHADWLDDIKSYCRDITGDFPYPIIADPSRDLARRLGMLAATGADTAEDPDQGEEEEEEENGDKKEKRKEENERGALRALYVVSPDHRLRLSMHYPTSTGRNVDEILRVIDSLQLVDRRPEIVTPANWTPGDKVMIAPSVRDEELAELFPKGVERVEMPSGRNYVRTTTDY